MSWGEWTRDTAEWLVCRGCGLLPSWQQRNQQRSQQLEKERARAKARRNNETLESEDSQARLLVSLPPATQTIYNDTAA